MNANANHSALPGWSIYLNKHILSEYMIIRVVDEFQVILQRIDKNTFAAFKNLSHIVIIFSLN